MIETLTGYDAVKRDLFVRQRQKCVYCESALRYDKGSPVEHFRPKAAARRYWKSDDAKPKPDPGYWWLAWTWDLGPTWWILEHLRDAQVVRHLELPSLPRPRLTYRPSRPP